MPRVNVYLPDDLAAQVKAAGLNVSSLTQEALRKALASISTDEWLATVSRLRPTGTSHEAVVAAVTEAKDELDRANA